MGIDPIVDCLIGHSFPLTYKFTTPGCLPDKCHCILHLLLLQRKVLFAYKTSPTPTFSIRGNQCLWVSHTKPITPLNWQRSSKLLPIPTFHYFPFIHPFSTQTPSLAFSAPGIVLAQIGDPNTKNQEITLREILK